MSLSLTNNKRTCRDRTGGRNAYVCSNAQCQSGGFSILRIHAPTMDLYCLPCVPAGLVTEIVSPEQHLRARRNHLVFTGGYILYLQRLQLQLRMSILSYYTHTIRIVVIHDPPPAIEAANDSDDDDVVWEFTMM